MIPEADSEWEQEKMCSVEGVFCNLMCINCLLKQEESHKIQGTPTDILLCRALWTASLGIKSVIYHGFGIQTGSIMECLGMTISLVKLQDSECAT